MRVAALLLFLALLVSPRAALANDRSACGLELGPILRVAYCGQYSTAGGGGGGGGGGGATDNRVACNFYVSPTGSDSNSGQSAAQAFLTLSKMQTTVQGNNKKVACLESGTYTASLTFTAADNGEVWETDPASPVNSAIWSGGGNSVPITLNSVNGWTLNGVKVTSGSPALIRTADTGGTPGNNLTIENSELSNNSGGSGGALQFCAVCMYNTTNTLLDHNYAHNTTGPGLACSAWIAGEVMTNCRITNNVDLSACQTLSDCGAIYTNAFNNGTSATSAGGVTIENNFVRDQGSASLTNDVVGIYLDDKSSNITVKGNIVGPPCAGCINTGNRNNTSGVLLNDDTYIKGVSASQTQNDTITGNIFDLGSSAMVMGALLGGTNTQWTGNVILMKFSGSLNTCASSNCGFIYSDASAVGLTIKNNAYVNYASGGTAFSNGVTAGDALPQKPTAAQVAISGYLYTLGSNSIVFGAPVSFPPIVGGWGPPGFVIPTSTNRSPS